jgi:uncharacterized membrane protein
MAFCKPSTTSLKGNAMSYATEESCESMEVNVGQEERWLSMFGAGALVAAGLLRGSPIFLLMGAGLAYRGATGHCPLYEATGLNTNKLQDQSHRRIAF